MATTENLGRIQGASIFTTTQSTSTSVTISTLKPTSIKPLVGDAVLFTNGDLRVITAVSSSSVTCGGVIANIKGATGASGTNGTNGVSISSVQQTTTSTADDGDNVITVTLSNGTTSTFKVQNGSKGSKGDKGDTGDDGIVSFSKSGSGSAITDVSYNTSTKAFTVTKGNPYSNATTSAAGLMSSTDKSKLDGIESGANKYSHPTTSGNKHIPSGGSSGQILRWSADGTAAWGADNNTTYSNATTTAAGLMSAADKTKLDGIATGANNYTYTLPAATSSTLGGVKVGSNITNTSGTISLTKTNVTDALGYTPPNGSFVPISGGTLNDGASLKFSTYGTRFITITGNSISADMSNETGGWAGNFASVKDPSGETTSMLGWYGSATGLTHIYMGGTYNDPYMKMTPAGTFTFKNTVAANISGNAATATSATKATQDGSGNVITSTYATKSEIPTFSYSNGVLTITSK